MAEIESSQEVRRSQREKKQREHFVNVDSTLLKRKRSDETTDDDGAQNQTSDSESDRDNADAEEDFSTPRTKAKGAVKRSRKTKAPQPAKKPRPVKKTPAPKATSKSTVPKPRKTAARSTTRKAKQRGDDAAAFDAEQVAKDTKISGDNPLFNAIMNPAAALQSTVEDFLESLTRTPGLSLAELIVCVLRACGSNDSVNADEVVDYDGVVDALDNFTEGLKKDDSPIYPLTSKLPVFKRFRGSLSELLERLIASSAELGSLYTSDLMATLQTWVVAMSSSQLRSFRHTATVIALEVETALCEVAAAVEKEAEVVSRQREGERKRRTTANKGKGGTPREKELETKAAEVRERRAKLAEYLKEFVDGVFVHRYRDLDPNIRAECVRAMGLWFEKYPAHFLDGAYLRYVGWVLSDAQTQVRLEAVRALACAYEQTAYIGAAALQHFTERFKPRLVEMAVGDIELSVRVAVIQVLQAIDGHGLLEDEQRERLCLLVFDEETRVRKAVSGFVRGVWEESVEERLVGKKASAKDKQRAQVKALGMLLVKWGRALDKASGEPESDEEGGNDLGEGPSKRVKSRGVASLIASQHKGRVELIVEALWAEVEPVSDWENLLDILLLDHSAAGEESSSGGHESTQDSGVDEAWRLEEAEEAILLEMLVAVIRKAKADLAGAKKGEDEELSSNITRALIKAMPRLFVKHQTDESRMADVLLIPQLMNLDLYLEMRMMTAYATLWEDISKQFLSHSSPIILANAVATIRYMMDATSLSKTNSTKILELEDELSTSLRDALAARDEIELASFSEDEVLALEAINTRLAALVGVRDMTAWMEEDEGGKQSSAWDIISALAERCRLGYREEEMMVDRALHVLTLHIIWKARLLTSADELSPEEIRFKDKLSEQRDYLLEKLLEFAVGTQSNTAEGVRRAAFQNLLNLHILFCPAQSVAPDGSRLPTASLPLTLDDDAQYRCAGFIQAEIERYIDELDISAPQRDRDSDDDRSDASQSEVENDGERAIKAKKAPQTQSGILGDRPTTRTQLEKEYVFLNVITTFLRAIRAGVIHFQHSTIILAHYGRLGPAFDLCTKVIIDILREEGMYKNNGDGVVAVICQALRDSFTLLLDGMVESEEHSTALAKSLAACFMIRGAQLAVIRKLDSQYIIAIHITSLSWMAKRLAAYESAKNKKSRNKAILFFKVLQPLVTGIDNRDALKIKAHLDQVIAQHKLDIPPTAKSWEPYRAYEKKLSTVLSKEKSAGTKGKRASKKAGKSAETVTTDDETGHETVGEDNAAPLTRPKPRARHRGVRSAAPATDEEGDAESPLTLPSPSEEPLTPASIPDEPATSAAVPEPRTPIARSRSRAAYQRRMSERRSTSPLTSSPEPEIDQSQLVTPLASRKRGRSPEREEEDITGGSQGLNSSQRAAENESLPSSSQASQATQVNEIRIKRKRVRH